MIQILICFPIIIAVWRIKNSKITPLENLKNKDIIKNLISAINHNVIYHGNDVNISVPKELYYDACYRDKLGKNVSVFDYLEYNLDSDTLVKLADLRATTQGRRGIYVVFEGITVKIIRNRKIEKNILIKKMQIYEGGNIIGEGEKIATTGNPKFEAIFDVYATDSKDIDIIINERIKNELVRLYEEYGIMFEISLRENNIYIRFFAKRLFELPEFGTTARYKKKLYRSYILFKTVLEMIKRINEIFSE